MALISCKECGQSVSTEAIACPGCGAPQQAPAPPPIPIPPTEQTIYQDNMVAVTSARVMIGSATYPLRNITSVKMLLTRPRLVKPILLLVIGVMILCAAIFSVGGSAPPPPGAFVIAVMMIAGAIIWMVALKTRYHVGLSSAGGEIHTLTSVNRAYIERIVLSINEAIVRHH